MGFHCSRTNLPFFVLYEWVGIWSAFLLLLLVAFNKAEIVPAARGYDV